MHVIAPRLGERRPVPGPPKRFAQGIGAVMSTIALVLGLVLGLHTAATVVPALLIPAAGLESILGYRLGCELLGVPMAVGVIPDDVCAACADVSLRWTP